MDSFLVVEVYMEMQSLREVFYCFEPVDVAKFLFQLTIEGFLPSILPRTGFGTLRRNDVVLEQPLFTRKARIFTALIGMEEIRRRTPYLCVFKGINNECRAVVESNRPPHNFSRVEINDRRKIDKYPIPDKVGEISGKHHTRPDGTEVSQSIRNTTLRLTLVLWFPESLPFLLGS